MQELKEVPTQNAKGVKKDATDENSYADDPKKFPWVKIVFVLIFLLFSLFILYKYATPPWEQPDTAHQEPERQHQIKNPTIHPRWMVVKRDSGDAYLRLTPPGESGGEEHFDEEDWQNILQKLVAHIRFLMKDKNLTQEKINLVSLDISKAFSISFGKNQGVFHEFLRSAFEDGYDIDIFFATQGEDVIVYCWYMPDTSQNKKIFAVKQQLQNLNQKLVGAMHVFYRERRAPPTFFFYGSSGDDYDDIPPIISEIVEEIKKIF
jgi:hypothetical protein